MCDARPSWALLLVLLCGCQYHHGVRLAVVDDNTEHLVVWPAPRHQQSDKTGLAVLYPIRDSDFVNDAKLFVLLGQNIDAREPLGELATHLVDMSYASVGGTAAVWLDVDGSGELDDLVVATKRGATSYSNIHVWLRTSDDHMVEMLSDGSRYIPYYGDIDGDSRAELYLSTADNRVDPDGNVVATTYRVVEWEPASGFGEARRVRFEDLPLDRLTPLKVTSRIAAN